MAESVSSANCRIAVILQFCTDHGERPQRPNSRRTASADFQYWTNTPRQTYKRPPRRIWLRQPLTNGYIRS
jgi:hypothetical protein